MLTGKGFMKKNDPQRIWIRSLGLLSVMVVDLVGYTGGGVAIGYLAWTRLHAPWWVLLLTSLSGLWLAMYQLYRLSKKEVD